MMETKPNYTTARPWPSLVDDDADRSTAETISRMRVLLLQLPSIDMPADELRELVESAEWLHRAARNKLDANQ